MNFLIKQNSLHSYVALKKVFIKICEILRFKKVKKSVILFIALLVALLITLPRVLSLYNITEELTDSFTAASINDIIFRFIFASVLFWIILQFNTNWKYIYQTSSKLIRITATIALNAIIFGFSIVIFNYSYALLVNHEISKNELGLIHFVYLIIILVLIFVSGVLRYQLIHKEDIIEKEQLKQEILQNELTALKNQINPHFLFNSLNSLTSLVRDNKEATIFINKLSYLYRYILQSSNQDLSTIKEELTFLESYVYLIKMRYRNRFSITIKIDEKLLLIKIPILALQLLVENCVKHNEISEELPLLVKIVATKYYLIVENRIQPKRAPVDSTGNGLNNLNKRNLMLKGKRIVITNTNNTFTVKLPLK